MIVVGVDGSRAGLEAVAWAAKEAALRKASLKITHAITEWAAGTDTGRYAEVARWMRQGGQSVLAAAEDRARAEQPQLTMETALLPGDPRAALISAGEEAELLVIGSHGLGGVRGMLVGSVAHGVAGRTACDLVLVSELPSQPRGEIVAGIDGSPASQSVLDFAFAEAELRGTRLRVVYAWTWPEPEPVDEGAERLMVRKTLAGHRERHPGVNVVEEIVQGHPVEALREAATGADLLVVGSRGRGTFAGLVLGSVSQALLHRSPCPLAVIRGRR